MENIYEEIYHHLINRGIEDEVATNFVNEMYDKEKYHGVEVLDEGVLRGLGAAARFLGRLSKTRVGRAGMFGTGAAGLGYAGYLADRPEKTEKPEVVKTKPAPETKPAPDTAPATPKDDAVADKKPSSIPDYNIELKYKAPKSLRPEVFKNKEEPKKETKKVEKPFDIRDRDVTARGSYDPRLKSERERMKRIRAEREARKDKNRTSS